MSPASGRSPAVGELQAMLRRVPDDALPLTDKYEAARESVQPPRPRCSSQPRRSRLTWPLRHHGERAAGCRVAVADARRSCLGGEPELVQMLTARSTKHATRATLMYLNRVPTVVITASSGRQDPGFMLRIYVHSTNDALAEVAATTGRRRTRSPLERDTRCVGCVKSGSPKKCPHEPKARRRRRAFQWWPGPGSNRRPSAFQADARTN